MKTNFSNFAKSYLQQMPRTRGMLLIGGVLLLTVAGFLKFPHALAAPPVNNPSPAASPQPTPPQDIHQWGAVTLFHGLPSDRVRAIAQTPDGMLWFGTDAGLAKFDGRRTQTINAPGLPQGGVRALETDASGTLWIGTESGAARLSGGAFQFINETKDKTVTAILPRDASRVFLATANGVVFDINISKPNSGGASYDRSDESYGSNAGVYSTFIVAQIPREPLSSADKENPGWLAFTSLAFAQDKLFAGSQSRGLFVREGDTLKEVAARPRSFFINALATDEQGRLWTGVQTGKEGKGATSGADETKPTYLAPETGTVNAVRRGVNTGEMWLGTDGRGAFQIAADGAQKRFTFDGTAGGLRSNKIYAVYPDREGVVWFGTDKGVSRYDPRAPQLETLRADDALANFVRALFQTNDGALLCGTNRGLFIADKTNGGAWREVAGLPRTAVYSFMEDDGRLYAATASGLFVAYDFAREKERAAFTRLTTATGAADASGSARALVKWNGAIYLALFGRGVERLSGDGRATLVFPLNDTLTRNVVSLHVDALNRLLVGTADDGVYVLETNSNAPTRDARLTEFDGATVRAFADASGGALWLATTRGLFLLTEKELLSVAGEIEVRAVQNLTRTAVNPLLISDEKTGAAEQSEVPAQVYEAWCATASGGVLRVAFAPGATGTLISKLDAEQGLPSQNTFALVATNHNHGAAQSSDNPALNSASPETLYIGTNRGLVRYAPGALAPQVYATRVLGKRVHNLGELATGIALEYPQTSVVLDVAATSSRTFPEQFQYVFTLRDAKHQLVKQKAGREAQFALEGLKPGAYRVEARAYSRDLLASAPLAFDLYVQSAPFPWTATILGVLLLFALVALWWGYKQNRNLRVASTELVATNAQLNETRLQLAHEAETERRRIARDLHDQTLADLRRLALLSDKLPAANGVVTNTGNAAAAKVAAHSNRSNENAPRHKARNANAAEIALTPAVLRAEIEGVSQEIRRICEDLSPSVLENVGFTAALEFALQNALAAQGQHGGGADEPRMTYEFACAEDVDDRLRLNSAEQMQLYRIAQEAANNAAQHSGGALLRCAVTGTADGSLLYELADDGRGFDPDKTENPKGRGLTGVRARAALIEAEVAWTTNRTGGTIFTLSKKNALELQPELETNRAHEAGA